MAEKKPKMKKVLSKQDYLKKYLSGGKKKKISKKVQKRVQIIDDNCMDCGEHNEDESNYLDDLNDEYAPQIVGIVDERPQDVKTLDTYKNKNRWIRVGGDEEDPATPINVDEVKNYVQQMNKSILNDIIKQENEDTVENGIPIRRDRKTGKKRDLKQEKEEQLKKDEMLKEHKEKYAIWGKGIKQVKDDQEKFKADLHEMQKPLARYADDSDLESLLKSRIRSGDPMLEYITNNRTNGDDSPDGVRHEVREFRGFCPPNRFGIRPGHAWDGVDRSNGFEEKWLLEQNSKKAIEDEAYKWSCSDM